MVHERCHSVLLTRALFPGNKTPHYIFIQPQGKGTWKEIMFSANTSSKNAYFEYNAQREKEKGDACILLFQTTKECGNRCYRNLPLIYFKNNNVLSIL
jgi:hypothetical protein